MERSAHLNFVMVDYAWEEYSLQTGEKLLAKLKEDKTAVLCLSSSNKNAMQNIRSMFVDLMNKK
jgi:(E)-4-hydroxy-3-methylbut-2-enyl-diphosphate synthase